MWQTLHPNIKARIKIQFLSRFGSSLIFPFMAIYLSHAYNAQTAGILMMINIVIAFLAGVYGGHLTDMYGRRPLLITGETIKLIGSAGIFLANIPVYHLPWLTFIMMSIGNVASGLLNPASEAMLIDVSTKTTRAFMYAINYWASNLSLMIGSMIGGWLFESHFIILASTLMIINTLSLLLTIFSITETYQSNQLSSPKIGMLAVFKHYQPVFKDLPFLIFTLGGILLLAVEFQRTNYIAIHLAEKFVHTTIFAVPLNGIKMISVLTTINTLIIISFTALFSNWIARYNTRYIFTIGTLLFTIGYALQATTITFLPLLISSLILSFGELMYVPNRQVQLANLMPKSRRGAYIAFNGSIFQLGKILASLVLVGSPLLTNSLIGILILFLGGGAIILTLLSLKMFDTHHVQP